MSLIAALAAGLALYAPADTLSDLRPEDRADLQCMAVSAYAIAVAEDDVVRAGLTAGLTYYYGRLQGRTPGADWLKRFADYAGTEPMADLETNRTRCAREMEAVGRAFVSTGTEMSKP